jgi:hypothetical protein
MGLRGQCGVLRPASSESGLCAAGAVDLVAGAGEVVADLLRDELLGLDRLPVSSVRSYWWV